MMKRNLIMTLYEILDIDIEASKTEINSAYTRLLSQYSLDAARGDKEAASKKINDIKYAKKILIDPESRKSYDAGLQSDISLNNTAAKVNLKKEPRKLDAMPSSVTDAELDHVASDLTMTNDERSVGSKPCTFNKYPRFFFITNILVFTVIIAAVVIINFVY